MLLMLSQYLLFELRQVVFNSPLASLRNLLVIQQLLQKVIELAIGFFLVLFDIGSVLQQSFLQFLQSLNQLRILSHYLPFIRRKSSQTFFSWSQVFDLVVEIYSFVFDVINPFETNLKELKSKETLGSHRRVIDSLRHAHWFLQLLSKF